MRRPAVVVAVSFVLAATACSTVEGASGPAPSSSVVSTDLTEPSEDAPPSSTGRATSSPVPTAPASPTDRAGTPTPSGAGATFTAADDGTMAGLRVGETAELLQADPLAADPRVDGTSVELVEVVSVAGTDRREWELRAIAPGTTHLAVPDDPSAFALTIIVHE